MYILIGKVFLEEHCFCGEERCPETVEVEAHSPTQDVVVLQSQLIKAVTQRRSGGGMSGQEPNLLSEDLDPMEPGDGDSSMPIQGLEICLTLRDMQEQQDAGLTTLGAMV